ncbi:exonuclease domain-containing protein [Bacillota bacterium Meth-B3]|nr:3'-5' exonuclease [Christensenellaceae bacterium]MEA5065606.1 3'-5' exonuclease [Eubacteriales bacterium]MEA5069529.1 3'-5' exonuclease [Christensenellaceae bacterium]
MKLIVFDTEATDLTPGQICQLSYLCADGEAVCGKNMFFAVDEMSEGAQQVHGMSIEDCLGLSGGARFEDRAEEIFEDFSGCDMLVGHNVSADDRYLRVELERCGMNLKKLKTFCTMNYFTGDTQLKRKVNTGRPKPPKLSELAEFFGVTGELIAEKSAEWFGGGGALHDARFDTVATYLCLVEASRQGKIRGLL